MLISRPAAPPSTAWYGERSDVWLFLKDAFLSIVQKPDQRPGTLTVRSRLKGDIQRVFPGAKVRHTPSEDYAYRAVLPRGDVALALAQAAEAIDYDNFKATVKEDDRHAAYVGVWSSMLHLQRARERDVRD